MNKSFAPFSRLPTELRIMIWKLTLEPRDVDFIIRDWETAICHEDMFSCIRLKLSEAVPAIFHACPESREVALSSYTLLKHAVTKKGLAYFNFDYDTLWLGSRDPNRTKYLHGHMQVAQIPDRNRWVFGHYSPNGPFFPTDAAEVACIRHSIAPAQLHQIKRVAVHCRLTRLDHDLYKEHFLPGMSGIEHIDIFPSNPLWTWTYDDIEYLEVQLRRWADRSRLRFPGWKEPTWRFSSASASGKY